MKKIVFMMTLFVAMVSLTSLQAAEKENTRATRSDVAVEQVTSRMARQLALSEPQRMEVMELNMRYHYLFEGKAPIELSDREYRKAWDKYENKLRHILSASQFTLYLSSRGALYADSPRPNVHVTVPRPQPAPRVTVPQGRNRQPMAGNGRTQGNRPQVGNGRSGNDRPNIGDRRSRSNPQQKGETPEVKKETTPEQEPI